MKTKFRKSALGVLLSTLAIAMLTPGCVTRTETVSYDPSLGPAYDVVNNPSKKAKRQGTFYSDDMGAGSTGPQSYSSR